MSQIGPYLKELRLKSDLPISRVAEAAGVSAPYLYQIEDGRRNPSAKILLKLARVYRVKVEDLLSQAGLLPEAAVKEMTGESLEDRIERAFAFVMRDPGVRAGSDSMKRLPNDAKLAIIRLYERAEGLKILPDEII